MDREELNDRIVEAATEVMRLARAEGWAVKSVKVTPPTASGFADRDWVVTVKVDDTSETGRLFAIGAYVNPETGRTEYDGV